MCYLPRPRAGQDWRCSQVGRAALRSAVVSPPLLGLSVCRPPLLEALPHSSSPSLTLSRSKGAAGLARPQRAARLGLQLRSCGKNMDKLRQAVSSSAATWLTFKRQGQIRIAVPLGAGMTGRGQEGMFSFLIWEQVTSWGYKSSLSFMICVLLSLYVVLP